MKFGTCAFDSIFGRVIGHILPPLSRPDRKYIPHLILYFCSPDGLSMVYSLARSNETAAWMGLSAEGTGRWVRSTNSRFSFPSAARCGSGFKRVASDFTK